MFVHGYLFNETETGVRSDIGLMFLKGFTISGWICIFMWCRVNSLQSNSSKSLRPAAAARQMCFLFRILFQSFISREAERRIKQAESSLHNCERAPLGGVSRVHCGMLLRSPQELFRSYRRKQSLSGVVACWDTAELRPWGKSSPGHKCEKGRKGPKPDCLRVDYSTIFTSAEQIFYSLGVQVCVGVHVCVFEASWSRLLNTIRCFHHLLFRVALCCSNSHSLTHPFLSHPEWSTVISSKGSECPTGCEARKFFRTLKGVCPC